MRPVPLLFMGIKRWQDIRPTDPDLPPESSLNLT